MVMFAPGLTIPDKIYKCVVWNNFLDCNSCNTVVLSVVRNGQSLWRNVVLPQLPYLDLKLYSR